MEYGLLGEKLPHSFSKEIHRQFGDYTYQLFEVEKENLDQFMTDRAFKGINVTMPYKQAVIPYLHSISPGAEKIGAVNTIVNKNGELYGYNTDYDGLKGLIQKNNIDLNDKKVLILGTGGTSKTAYAVAEDLNAGLILKVSRKETPHTITYESAYAKHCDADVIINTTPVGMFPELQPMPINLEPFTKLSAVVDVIYNPLRTSLVLAAQKKGITATGGMYMLIKQGAAASEHFFSSEIAAEKTEAAYRNLIRQKQNIVLTGMPSCGKTTVGTELSKRLNCPFYDTDLLIEKQIGTTISEFFKTHSEQEFREIESKIIEKLSTCSGSVIATGGGAVLREKNIINLKRNGKIFFIDRPLETLIPTDDRPLSANTDDLKRRYNERYSVYKETADVVIPSEYAADGCLLTADKILQFIYLHDA